MENNKKVKKAGENGNKRKNEGLFYWVQYGMITISMLIIIFHIILMICSIFSNSSTINWFGKKIYICAYNDEDMNFEYGDLIVATDFSEDENYNDYTGLIYKPDNNRPEVTVIKRRNYNAIKNNGGSIQGKIVSNHKKVGLLLLFIRDFIAVTFIALVILGVYTIYAIIRKKYPDAKRTYLRRIKDICVLMALLIIYISTLYVRQVVRYNAIYESVEIPNMNEKPDDDEKDNNGGTQQKPSTTVPENPPVQGDFNIVITDETGTWSQGKNLDVFKNEYFKDKNKIAPGVSGRYEFQVQNKSEYNVDYEVNIKEQNEHNINLLYRIQKNGKFIDSEYQKITNYSKIVDDLNSKETDTYTIYWKWFDAENDTEIGKNAENVKYILNFSIVATQK